MRSQGTGYSGRSGGYRLARSKKPVPILPIIVIFLLAAVVALGVLLVLRSRETPSTQTPSPTYSYTAPPTDAPTDAPTATPTPTPTPEPTPVVGQARLQFMGDLLLHETTTLKGARQADGSYNYDAFFTEIDPYINGDFVLANTDVLIDAYGDGTRYSSYPRFNSPRAIATAMAKIGVTGLITCNNHALDFGYEGLLNSNRAIRECGLDPIGAYETQEQRDNYYYIKEVNGIRIGVLCYGDWVNDHLNVYKDYPFTLKIINHSAANREMMRRDLAAIRERGAEFVIVSMHCGLEYSSEPSSSMRVTCQVLLDNGADLIMGTHPHTVHPITYRSNTFNGKAKNVLVAYSLGNFFADQRGKDDPTPRTEQGVILTVDIKRDDNGDVVISDASYLPTYTLRRQAGEDASGPIYHYQILPAGKYALSSSRDPYLENDEEWQLLKDAWNQTTTTMGSAIRADAGNN